eukprot:CAMPEP_0185735224 /NCGR_PEP_ID=MMETSP1171-20130828/24627_1 /TAXON_ID=374046 /ORGANISM="Helicotheca tamensis, Strain CCMP826" /LENGTH=96 /DNA_ID=CAMNT_0028405439 /DNA_START=20 /DNA_END=306 /DNA_ORIENTATION=+
MIRSITQAATSLLHRASIYRQTLYPQLSLAGAGLPTPQSTPLETDTHNNNAPPTIMDALWFAVPKKRVSKGKKRMKTTVQKRVKVKNHIMVDGRTG